MYSRITTIGLWALVMLVVGCTPQSSKKPHAETLVSEQNTDDVRIPPLESIMAHNQQVQQLAGSMQFLEGPIWDSKNNRLIFSEVLANKLHTWSEQNGVETFLEPSGYAGGNYLSPNGDIISCQGGARQVARITADKSVEAIADGFDGLKMDEKGNLYAACGDGVNIFTPTGALIGMIETSFEVTNLCFGGSEGNILFLTGHEGLYSIPLLVKGL